MDIDEYFASLEGNEDDTSTEEVIDEVTDEEAEAEIEQDTDEEEVEAETDPVREEDEPAKKTQTSEENARFAEQRRQKQIDDRVAAELDKLRQNDPAFKVAKQLSELYGQPIEEIQKQLEEVRLQEQAKHLNVPIEIVKQLESEKQARIDMQTTLNRIQFESWISKVSVEEASLQKEYPMLTADDMMRAKSYILETFKDTNRSLEEAIHAIHGKKIIQSLKESAKNEALAEVAGRKKGALPPQTGGKPNAATILTDAEKYFAKQMGLTDDEYIKWR